MRYPGAVRDPDTGAWISDAEVAEIAYTAFASTTDAVTARLIVRRVKDARYPDALFPVWRHHPFFTNSAEPAADADITHRRHAIIETVFADLIDGPLAHMPSGRFGANSAWVLCAAIAHNLLRAAGMLAGGSTPSRAGPPCAASSSTSPPGWPALNADPSCTCPATGPGPMHGLHCGTTPSATQPTTRLTRPPPTGPTRNTKGKAGQTSRPDTPTLTEQIKNSADHTANLIGGSRLSPRMTVSLPTDLRPLERGRNALVGGGIRRETLRQVRSILSAARTRRRQPR